VSKKKTTRPVGRPPGAISKKRAMAAEVLARLEAELGASINPLEGLLRIGADSNTPLNIRVQALSDSLPYLYPKLQSQTVALTGGSGGPVELASLDVGKILSDPALAAAAQDLALAVVEQDVLEAREVLGLPPVSESQLSAGFDR